MNKFFIASFLLIFSLTVRGQQYEIVSEEDAIAAVEILNNQSDVIAWCDCCGDEDYMKYIQVESAYYEYAYGEGNDSYVFLSGYDEYGGRFDQAVDLAYIYIADGELAVRVSEYIGLVTDACSEYFSYYYAYPFAGDYEAEEEYYEYSEGTEEYDSDEGFGYADAPYNVESPYVYLSSFDCGDYCYLNFESQDTETSYAIVIDPSEYPEFFFDSEYGYYLNPDLEGLGAYVTYEIIDIEYEDGTYGTENVMIGIELAD